MEISSSERRSDNDRSAPAQSPIPNPQSPIPNPQSPILARYSLFAILLLALFLRLHCLTCSSYWHDEGNTWALVQRGFAQIAADAAADIHPPGYYWLLKLWSLLFGYSPWALRAFSALTGALTVAVVYAIAKTVSSLKSKVQSPESSCPRSPDHSPFTIHHSPFPIPFPLLAAFLAAVNPFQIYYSQEARMYSLLMLESAALVWAVTREGKRQKGKAKGGEERQKAKGKGKRSGWRADHSPFTIHHSLFTISFSLLAAAGLWTHYIFPVVLAAVILAWLLGRLPFTIHNSPFAIRYSPISNPQSPIPFLLANLLTLLLFLPWLPTAINRVLSWPAGGASASALDGLRLTLQTLAVGPIRSGPELPWPWLLLVGLLPLLGLWQLRRNPAMPFLALWLLAPIGLMFGLGLFTDSFLKFLLTASPAWCILVAYCVVRVPYFVSHRDAETPRESHASRFTSHLSRFTFYASTVTTYAVRSTQYAIPLAAIFLAYTALPAYYADPAARDNYAGMAATVAALGDPAADGVILNAPGQADVWRIYDPGLSVLALPRQRPADRAATEDNLAGFMANRSQLFALFWATEQADPQRIVEDWLNRNAYKGLESWQGNVRFVQYSLPDGLACEELSPPARFGDAIQLTRLCLPPQRAVVAGSALPVALHWRTDTTLSRRYKGTLQLLNQQNQVIGQQDGEPGGGELPTHGWQPGAEVIDQRGLYAPPGSPPVSYRLILALYDSETGQRLPVGNGDALELGAIRVQRPARPLPPEIVPMRARLDRPVGPLHLVGYDAYAKGFAHDPTRPLSPGELLHVTLYWQAPDPLPAHWPDDLQSTLSLGGEAISAALAGGDFPTSGWQAGDFARGDVDIPYRADGALNLTVGGQTIWLGRVVDGQMR